MNGNISDVLRRHSEPVNITESDVNNGLEMGRNLIIDKLREDNTRMAAQIETMKWVIRELICSNTGGR